MSEIDVQGPDGQPVHLKIESICGLCVHWIKNTNGEIGTGICMALPASIVLKGNALIKVRGNYNEGERGCTGLFTPRADVIATAMAAAQKAANESGDGAPLAPAGVVAS